MSNIALQDITIPSLGNTYTVPQIDNTLAVTGAAADAKKTGDEISSIKQDLTGLTTATSSDVGKALKVKTVTNNKVSEWEFGTAGGVDPSDIQTAVDEYLTEHPVVASAAGIVSVADYGAVGDGVTDDSAAIQSAVDANYDVYFESNKTYYLASTVTIDHDIKLHGGENTVIKTVTPSGGTAPIAFEISGTLKKTTALTSDYTTDGSTDNSGNQLTLSDMTNIAIGDIVVVEATDQLYNPSRAYYYLGATLSVVDVYDGHVYVNISIPWDIENTANVTVKVYDAPRAIIDNLNFVSDLDSRGNYIWAVNMSYNNGSIVRNCSMVDCDCDMNINCCVNTLVDNLSIAHSKYDNSLARDGYGLQIRSSTNTIIQRMIAMSGQHTILTNGGIPCIDTYIRDCEISSECRVMGINQHEASWNMVVEDCTIGGINANGGPTIINRCRFLKNNRVPTTYHGIIISGNNNPDLCDVVVRNCRFDEGMAITINSPTPQDPVQTINAVVGSVLIEDCIGGHIRCEPTIDQYIISNKINSLIIRRWRDCTYIIHKATMPIEYLEVVDCTFTREDLWLYENSGDVTDMYEGVTFCNRKSNNLIYDRLFVHLQDEGGAYNNLPENVSVTFESDDSTGHYIVCGKNLASNDPDDYSIGNMSSNVGSAVTWTEDSNFSNALSVNGSGNLVYTMPTGISNTRYIKLKTIACVNENRIVKCTCKLKNTGSTDGATFRMYVIVIDSSTGLITSRKISDNVVASADGALLSFVNLSPIPSGSLVVLALYNRVAVADSQTTLEDYAIELIPECFGDSSALTYEAYTGSSRDGDGTLMTVDGMNYVMGTPSTFDAKFKADL